MQIKKGKFNIFDGLLILVAVAAIAVVTWFFWPSEHQATIEPKKDEDAVEVTYELKLTKIDDKWNPEKYLTEGEYVYEYATKNNLGKIVSVRREDSPYYGFDGIDDKQAEPDYFRGFHDWYITVVGNAVPEKDFYSFDGTVLMGAIQFKMRTDLFTSDCSVVYIRETASEQAADAVPDNH